LIAQSVATPAEKQAGFPNLSMAFDYEVQASLHLNNTANAFGTAQTMLRTVAYDDLASDAVNGTVRYVQLIHTDQALALLEQRQPLLLALLKAGPTGTTGPAMKSSTRPLLTIHDLYADAIALPAMQQFASRPDAAATSFAELEAALPPNLSPDDAILTAASRRQYLILGSPLPAFSASASLLDPASIPPDLQRKAAGASAFLLFPNWCAQCVAMNTLFASAADSLKQEGVKFYALLAQTNPRPPLSEQVAKLPSTATSDASKPHKRQMGAVAKAGMPHIEIQVGTQINVANQLVGTPTLVVPDQTLDIFVATDFPLLIVTDPHGIVRYIQTAPQNALVEGGLIYQVAQRVLQQWPASRPR